MEIIYRSYLGNELFNAEITLLLSYFFQDYSYFRLFDLETICMCSLTLVLYQYIEVKYYPVAKQGREEE